MIRIVVSRQSPSFKIVRIYICIVASPTSIELSIHIVTVQHLLDLKRVPFFTQTWLSSFHFVFQLFHPFVSETKCCKYIAFVCQDDCTISFHRIRFLVAN